MKKILFIATGGTIASSPGDKGLEPDFDAEDLITRIPEIEGLCNLSDILLMQIDSTNMQPESVKEIARKVYENYDDYDGFVVTHGTDTMAYTSALLTYMLSNIKKPVVLTGSQIPIGEPNTDARKNISDAVRFVLEGVPGVFIAFDRKIINGTRAVKVRSRSMNAFESINCPCVAFIKDNKINYNDEVNWNNKYQIMNIDPDKSFELKSDLCLDVFLLKFYPGIDYEIFDFIKKTYKGVVIEAFGLGGVPNLNDYNITKKVKELMEAGVAVVISTQCIEDGIDLEVYEVAKEFAEHPRTIEAGDMTTEAAIGKLRWALGNFDDFENVKSFIETSVAGDRRKETK